MVPVILRRPPPALEPYVACLWYSDAGPGPTPRERALPTGAAHLAFRLSDEPIHVFRDDADTVGERLGHAVIAGPRAVYHVRDTSLPVRSLGVQLRPGAAALLGAPAGVFAGRHVPVAALDAPLVDRDRLAEARPQAALVILEDALLARLPTTRPPPAVRFALRELGAGARPIDAIRAETGFSARHFIALFTRWVGLTPKVYARLARFRRALAASRGRSWSEVALAGGYADQSHLTREFHAFAGISPGAYRASAPVEPNHVPIGPRVQAAAGQLHPSRGSGRALSGGHEPGVSRGRS